MYLINIKCRLIDKWIYRFLFFI